MNHIALVAALTVLLLPVTSEAGSANTYKPESVGPALSVDLSATGSASVAGARVIEVRPTGFTAETLWGANRLTWTVQVSSETTITRKSGTALSFGAVTPGDYVSFTGTVAPNLPPFTVDARSVRDWSVVDGQSVAVGMVERIDMHNKVLAIRTKEDVLVLVRTTEDTSFAQNGAQYLADLSVGDTVTVAGTYGAKGSLGAVKVNLTAHAPTKHQEQKVATGLGPWVDTLFPQLFAKTVE